MALKTFTTADGSANQALVTNGSGVLSFAAVGAAAGQVIQVVTATDQTSRSTSSTSFVTGSNTLSVTITPSATANKIFLIATTSGGTPDYNNRQMFFTIYRGATNLGNGDNGLFGYYGGYVVDFFSPVVGISMSILDSPNTTSATTYQVYFRSPQSVNGYINYNNSKASITAFEIKG